MPIQIPAIQTIKWMRTAGMSIELLIEYVGLVHQGSETNGARKKLLIEQRIQLAEKIEELQATLKLLDKKLRVTKSMYYLTRENCSTQNNYSCECHSIFVDFFLCAYYTNFINIQ